MAKAEELQDRSTTVLSTGEDALRCGWKSRGKSKGANLAPCRKRKVAH